MNETNEATGSIAARLKSLRLENDWTFDELAEKIGDVSAPTLYRIENGLSEPNERTTFKIEKFMASLSNPPAAAAGE